MNASYDHKAETFTMCLCLMKDNSIITIILASHMIQCLLVLLIESSDPSLIGRRQVFINYKYEQKNQLDLSKYS